MHDISCMEETLKTLNINYIKEHHFCEKPTYCECTIYVEGSKLMHKFDPEREYLGTGEYTHGN